MSTSTPGPRRTQNKTPSLARSNITACTRCRQKKKRCDQQLPTCGLCKAAGAECVGYDAVAGREIPRSYILSLEERVAYLELELQSHGIQYRDLESIERTMSSQGSSGRARPPGSTSGQHSLASSRAAARAMLDRIQSPALRSAEDEPAFSRILLGELMQSKQTRGFARACRSSPSTPGDHTMSDMVSDLDTSPVSLPTKDATQTLLKAFFQFTNQGMPLLHEPTFRKMLEHLYSMPSVINLAESHSSNETKLNVFFVFEVFAVALMVMHKQNPAGIPTSLADRYHNTAVRALSEAGLPSDVSGVQALLLVGMYSYHHLTIWATWKSIGAALRLAVELGLHQDPPPNLLDPLTLDVRRRVFWVAYSLDRNVLIALDIPSCLSDGAIKAEFPSSVDDEFITQDGIQADEENDFQFNKGLSLHLFKYRRIQSEMRTVLYEEPYPAYGPVDWGRWQQNMRVRIQTWFDDIPRGSELSVQESRDIEHFELTYHRALLFLYYPSPNIPSPSESTLLCLTDAATQVIQLYRRFFLEHRLTIYWQAVENITSAGIALMFTYVNSPRVRERITFSSLESIIRSCSSLLWGMIEHFPAFNGKRDAFDLVASKVLANLATNAAALNNVPRMSSSYTRTPGDHNDVPMITETSPALVVHEVEGQTEVNRLLQPHFAATISGFSSHHPYLPQTAGGDLDINHDTSFSLPDFDGQSPLPFDWDTLQNMNHHMSPAWM